MGLKRRKELNGSEQEKQRENDRSENRERCWDSRMKEGLRKLGEKKIQAPFLSVSNVTGRRDNVKMRCKRSGILRGRRLAGGVALS